MEWSFAIGLGLALAAAGFVIAWRCLILPTHQKLEKARAAAEAARQAAETAKQNAQKELHQGQNRLAELENRLRREIEKERQRWEEDYRDRREEQARWERRLAQREEQLERRHSLLDEKERALAEKANDLERERLRLEELVGSAQAELERISGLTPDLARQLVLSRVEQELQQEIARRVLEAEETIKREAEERAKKILVTAMQRCAVEVASEMTVTVVSLPQEEMKGRIIGREGRNIRTFELLTGVDLIIDDTPEAVVISSFDPIRRETARMALQMLIADGRIHPARIEEAVEKARQEMENRILQAGQEASRQAAVTDLPEGLLKLLGRLKFRSSFGQNVLDHSVEVAHLAGLLAEELKVNSYIARRAGLLHDIGKALDYHMEGSHTEIGVEVLRRYGESEEVIHAVAAHHEDIPPQTVEAVLILIADALSAARPGARRESFEAYIRRLEKLECIARSFSGVDKAYVIQAGREVRVIVKPNEVDDAQAAKLARDIAQAVAKETQFPGQTKITVIRELRAVQYAR